MRMAHGERHEACVHIMFAGDVSTQGATAGRVQATRMCARESLSVQQRGHYNYTETTLGPTRRLSRFACGASENQRPRRGGKGGLTSQGGTGKIRPPKLVISPSKKEARGSDQPTGGPEGGEGSHGASAERSRLDAGLSTERHEGEARRRATGNTAGCVDVDAKFQTPPHTIGTRAGGKATLHLCTIIGVPDA